MTERGYPPVLHNTASDGPLSPWYPMRVLGGPHVDSLRVGLFQASTIDGWAFDLLRDAKTRALHIRAGGSSDDIAVPWPRPHEHAQASLQPVDWVDEASGEVLQVWPRGGCQALPKIARGPILADVTSGAGGPGFVRIRGGNASKRYPYAVILDLSSDWLWRFRTPQEAVGAAVEWWHDAGLLDPRAVDALQSGAGHRVTRCDIACDHQTAEGWAPESYKFFSCRSKQRGFEAGTPKEKTSPDTPPASAVFGPRSFTLYLGKRGGEGAMWRLYLKTAQLAATAPRDSQSAWFWSPITKIWTSNGWNRVNPVWRAEVEVPSRMLHALDGGRARMSSLAGLDVARLWSHCASITRHTDTDTGRGDLRKTSRVWRMIQSAVPTFPRLEKIPSMPDDARPDLGAIRSAVGAAIGLGATLEDVRDFFLRGVERGERIRADRDRRAVQIEKVLNRHDVAS
jgi:hypothetical protein